MLLRKPRESDVLDRYKCGRSKELVRMHGGDARNSQPFTMKDARQFVERVLANELDWCIEYEGPIAKWIQLIPSIFSTCAEMHKNGKEIGCAN